MTTYAIFDHPEHTGGVRDGDCVRYELRGRRYAATAHPAAEDPTVLVLSDDEHPLTVADVTVLHVVRPLGTIAQRIAVLRAGARALKHPTGQNPAAALAAADPVGARLLAGWLDAEAACQGEFVPFVELLDAVISNETGRVGTLSFGLTDNGDPAMRVDTSPAATRLAVRLLGGDLLEDAPADADEQDDGGDPERFCPVCTEGLGSADHEACAQPGVVRPASRTLLP